MTINILTAITNKKMFNTREDCFHFLFIQSVNQEVPIFIILQHFGAFYLMLLVVLKLKEKNSSLSPTDDHSEVHRASGGAGGGLEAECDHHS